MFGSHSRNVFDAHFQRVLKTLTEGELVFFLGAGANLCGRPDGKSWQRGEYLPNSSELAHYLASQFEYPSKEKETQELIRVSQYADTLWGSKPLYNKLRFVFDVDYPPTRLHQFLASLPSILREKGYERPYPLIVTTNYDDVLECAFKAVDQKFDLVTYVAETPQRGKFMHRLPTGESIVINIPNEYSAISLEQRPVILKIHGAIDRRNSEQDSFVITEDHYIDYLSRTDTSAFIPVTLKAILQNSYFLFCGYSLRDWNLRVILHRLWSEQTLRYNSWAIQLDPEELDQKFWGKRNVDILNIRLEDYVATLQERLQALPPAGARS